MRGVQNEIVSSDLDRLRLELFSGFFAPLPRVADEIRGKAVDAASGSTAADVLDMLGIEISPARMKCALLSLETLQGALGSKASTPDPAKATPA